MYYRYEVRMSDDEPWRDIFTVFDGYERNRVLRVLPEPNWNANHPEVETEWWMTQYAYERYGKVFDEIIGEMYNFHPKKEMERMKFRLHTVEKPDNIVFESRTQCLSKVSTA